MIEKISDFNKRQFMLNSNFEIFHYRQPYFKTLDFHNHDFYELYFFMEGSVTYYLEEIIYELMPGDMLVIPPGKMHRPAIFDSNTIYERIVLWINSNYIKILDEASVLPDMLNEMISNKAYLLHFENTSKITDTLKNLLKNFNSPSQRSIILNKAYMTILISTLYEQYLSVDIESENNEETGLIPKIITYINEHLDEDLSLDMLANNFFISKFHLLRKFKEYTNSTLYDYIISKRIIYAKKLIRDGVPATVAYGKCGFSDYSNFYKSFVSKTELTPKQFKAMINNEETGKQ